MPAPTPSRMIGHGYGYGLQAGYFGYSYYDLTGSPDLQPDFMSALEAAWNRNPACERFPIIIDLQPAGTPPPYAVLLQAAVDSAGNNPSPGYWDLIEFSIAILQNASTSAVVLGEAAIAALDAMLAGRLPFANGYQINFYRSDQRLMKEKGTGPKGNVRMYRQQYTYRVWIGRSRPYANLT